jgi:hypothetical protein
MTQIQTLIQENETAIANNVIETFFALYGGSNLELFETGDLFDFRNILTCYSTVFRFSQVFPAAYNVLRDEPYTFAQALQDAPAPDLEVNSPIVLQAIDFLDRSQSDLPISEYLISRISQILSTRV